VLVSLPISFLLMRPVRRLEGATREVAAGNLDVEVPRAAGRGELSQLMASFEQMTRDLRDAQDLQARAERAAAWREMAQQIAHDVKNPLTPIKLTIQNLLALQKEAPDIFEEEFERGSGLILEQIDQLQRIAGNFSSFASMPTRQADPVDVAALLKETAELHGAAGAIDLDLDTGELVVRADRDELSRVLHNLLSNARESEAKSIQLRGGRQNGQVRIDIVDDGRGIDPAAMDRIFEPSFTTRTRGTGLGLPIVKRIVDDLDGTIAIDSKVGSGTRVTILLPRA
jgi:nitrogen fixation/metabolism regulation signal transduction histidine kinase